MERPAAAGGAGDAQIDELVAEDGEVEKYSSGPRHVVGPVAGGGGALAKVVPLSYHEASEGRHHMHGFSMRGSISGDVRLQDQQS